MLAFPLIAWASRERPTTRSPEREKGSAEME